MARNDSERYELTDAEKRDLIKLIEQGRPLPEKYRFLLFEDKREVELVWNGGQSFRARQNRELELLSATHTYDKPGRYVIAVKVIDIFGNDTMSLISVTVG